MRYRPTLSLLGVLALAACGEVSGVNQKADAVPLDWRTSSGIYTPPSRTEKLLVGSQEKGTDYRVPVTVSWGVQKDDAGCLRVTSVKIARTGGATSTEIYKAKVTPIGTRCAKRDPSYAESFDMVNVSYCWRWNGAANDAECAYGGGFTISGDAVGLEGIVDRQP